MKLVKSSRRGGASTALSRWLPRRRDGAGFSRATQASRNAVGVFGKELVLDGPRDLLDRQRYPAVCRSRTPRRGSCLAGGTERRASGAYLIIGIAGHSHEHDEGGRPRSGRSSSRDRGKPWTQSHTSRSQDHEGEELMRISITDREVQNEIDMVGSSFRDRGGLDPFHMVVRAFE